MYVRWGRKTCPGNATLVYSGNQQLTPYNIELIMRTFNNNVPVCDLAFLCKHIVLSIREAPMRLMYIIIITRPLLRLERTMNLLEGGKGGWGREGGEGTEGGWGERVGRGHGGEREGGGEREDVGEREGGEGRLGREGICHDSSLYLFVLVLFLEAVVLSQVHVAWDIFYQHIVHVYRGVVYNHHLCLCDVHLKAKI